ncbi:MAG: hypothetical protein HRT73_08085, partial [Flavobacteriales bacterium]|nr:hypothetical protein [Flavobacteriales bacterium]
MKHLNKIFILLSIITLIGINKIEAQNVIWAEDFTNGIPAAWMTMDNNGNNYDWVINDQSIVNDTSSPAGITNTTPIASGSGGNHMLLWGGEYNRLAGTNIDLDSYFQTSGIAITGQPSYTVNFQQKFKRCCANTGIEVNLVVSTDPTFATNVSTFDIVGGVATNVQSADPMNMSIDISSIVGGVTGIFYMRFHVAAGSTSYYWMIDDITVETCATNSNFTTIDNGNGNYSFVNTSSGNFYTYWNFGDGIISNLVNPN